jgi:NAD(P)H-nitrite reductase large subunit
MWPCTWQQEVKLDDEICLCFGVTKRKVMTFIRVEKVQRAGQLADCFGAGTGCGWCRPFLEGLLQDMQETGAGPESPSPQAYAEMRERFLRSTGRTATSETPQQNRPPDATGQDRSNPLS